MLALLKRKAEESNDDFTKASYISAILPEHKGNPLIEALPRKLTDEEIVRELEYYPSCKKSERHLKPHERNEYLSRIEKMVQPLPEYILCYRMIESAIRESYSSKNPFCPTTNYYLTYLSHSKPSIEPDTGAFRPRGKAMTVMGVSGVGKSRMIERCLGYFPQVIEHDKYKDQRLPLKAIGMAIC